MATDPVKAAAQRYRINPALFRALVQQESGGNQNARSKAGAIGETQLMPETARGLGVDPYNQQQNLDGGAKYLRQQLDRFGGDVRKALAAYNAGPGAVQKYNGVPPYAETQHYVATILANAGRAGAAPSTPTAPNVPAASGTTTTVTPGVDNSLLRRQLVSQFLQAGGVKSSNASLAFASGLQGAQDTPATRTTQTTPAARAPARAAAQPQGGGGLATFDGKQVAGWIAPALEYARQHGWKGTVSSGYRSTQHQAQLYADFQAGRRRGPVAAPGTSNHEGDQFPRGAVDVTNASQLSAILANSPYRSRLVWAGGKDPVHFSHPHNGGY
jgi:hypothetical protein